MKDEGRIVRTFLRRSRIIAVAFVSSFIVLPSSFLLADSIFVGNLETKNVTFKEVRGDTLIYEVNSRSSERQEARISRLVVATEAPLTAAEEAYSLEKWDAAVDGYLKVIRTTNKPWIKDWSAIRLLKAGTKS